MKTRLISKQASWQGVDSVQRQVNPGREKRMAVKLGWLTISLSWSNCARKKKSQEAFDKAQEMSAKKREYDEPN